MTAPTDSFASIVAELRDFATHKGEWCAHLADTIERLDAEMREAFDIANQRGDEWRRKFNEDTDTIADLRARLAACEKALQLIVDFDPAKHAVGVSHNGGPMIPTWRDIAIRALATRASVPKDAATGDEGEK